jgi:hypothetical protein
MLGIIHSAVIYFFPLFVFRFGNQDHFGRSHTLWDQSLLGVLTVLIVQYYIIFQDTFLYSTPVIIAHSVQITFNIFFFVVYGFLGNDQLGAYTFDIVSNVKFWFTLIITLAIDLLFVIISRKIDILLSDNIINNLRNRKYEDDYLKKLYIKKLEHMAKCTRSIAKFKKIYKQIDQYQAENYADRKMKEFVEMYRKNKRKDSKAIVGSTSPYKSKVKDHFTAYGIKTENNTGKNEIIETNMRPETTVHRYTDSDHINLISNKEIQFINPTAHRNNNKSLENSKDVQHEPDVVSSTRQCVKNTNTEFDIEKEVEVYEDIETKVICFPVGEDIEKDNQLESERKLSLNKLSNYEVSITSREKEN